MDAEKPKKDIECLYCEKFHTCKHGKVKGKKCLNFEPMRKKEGDFCVGQRLDKNIQKNP